MVTFEELLLFSLSIHLLEHRVLSTTIPAQDCGCNKDWQTRLDLLALLPDCHKAAAASPITRQYPSWDQADCVDFVELLDFTVDLINNSSKFLPCHNLRLVYREDGCSGNAQDEKLASSLVSGLFPRNSAESRVVGILGPACLESARKVVYVADKPEIDLIVLHTGGSLMLGRESKNSLDILGSSRSLFDLSIALIEESGWHNICILYDSSHHHYRHMKDEFIETLAPKAVNIAVTVPVSQSYYPVDEVRSSRVRIVFIFASLKLSRTMLCLAYDNGLVYPTHQWVILSHTFSRLSSSEHTPAFVRYSNGRHACSKEDMLLALEGAYFISKEFIGHQTSNATFMNPQNFIRGSTSLGNLTFSLDFQTSHRIMQTYWMTTLFDALVAWIFVLHNLTTFSPEALFNYHANASNSLTEFILEHFHNLSFEGASGRVSFNSSSGFANRQANLYQVMKGKQTLIGTGNESAVSLTLPLLNSISDHIKVIDMPEEGYIIFFIVLACIECVIVVLMHVMTFIYREKKSVKAASPKLIYLAFVGAYAFIATLLVNLASWLHSFGPNIDVALCQLIWAWGLPLSFTLTMGIVTVRTWRLYRIFVHYLNPGKFISNPALTAAVLLLVSVDVVIAVIWTSVDPMQFEYSEITLMDDSGYEVLLRPQCYYNTIWLVLIFSYKASLLIALIILTVQTRRIPHRSAMNFATNSTRLFTYSFTIVSVIGFMLYYALVYFHQGPDAEFSVLALLLNTMLVLFIMFIIAPPLVPIVCSKKERNISS